MAALQNTMLPKITTPPSFLGGCPVINRVTLKNPMKMMSLKFASSLSLSLTKRRGGGCGPLSATNAEVEAAICYANALAEVAQEADNLDNVASDIDKVDQIFSDTEVYDFFSNPTLDVEHKQEVLADIIKSSALQPETGNFLNLLLDVGRLELLKVILKEFESEHNKLTDTELVLVTSVVQLENDNLAQIAKGVQSLTGAKNVRIKTKLDPSLVAGFTIRYGPEGSRFVDMSVKKQLEEIADALDVDDLQLAAVPE